MAMRIQTGLSADLDADYIHMHTLGKKQCSVTRLKSLVYFSIKWQ